MLTRLRAFTLIELMVAIGITLAVSAAALGALLAAVATQREGAVRASLTRTGQQVVDSLSADLSYLGAGVPRGYERNQIGILLGLPKDDAAKQLRPAVRIGRHDYLAFLGDLPFPNSELNGIAAPGALMGTLMDPPLFLDDRVSVTSELSPCTPPTSLSSVPCASSADSLVPIGGDDCDENTLDAPTCPWGLGKWQRTSSGSVPLVVGLGDGTWLRRRWDMESTATSRERLFIDLDELAFPGGGTEEIHLNLLGGAIRGVGFFSHLDRVFYSLETAAGGAPTCDDEGCTCGDAGCALWRRQCWGWDVENTNPDAPGFPAVGAAPIRSGQVPDDCGAPSDGTPWEAIAEGISSLSLRFYAADGARLIPGSDGLTPAQASRTRHVEVVMELTRRPARRGPVLIQRLARRFYLEHAGGLMSRPATLLADGGCDAAGPANECFPQ